MLLTPQHLLCTTPSSQTSATSPTSDNYHLNVSGGAGNISTLTVSTGRAHPGGLGLRNGRLGGNSDSAYNSLNSLCVPYMANRSRTPSPSVGRHLQQHQPHPKKQREKSEDVKKARKQVIKMLIVVVVLFLLCWGPTIIMEICINLGFQKFDQNFRRSMRRMMTTTCQPCVRKVPRRGCCPPQRPLQTNLLNRMVTRTTVTTYSSYSPEVMARHTHMETVSAM
ncbi:hypothetical protein SK128_013949 [Halocaridina rubra]|uniref:G-protein coupled receptors family 1 profile domain-containing protein n=1 Tax=Halocaridina rubra TaxID=373956 RepID=A0AAN8WR71_HALRR